MNPVLNVLISSAGRRVALLDLFRATLAELGVQGRMVATDMSLVASAVQRADVRYRVPRCTDADFVPRMLEICAREKVGLIVPTIDTELPIYAAHRAQFAAAGVTVSVSGPETIAIGGDKVKTHEWLCAKGFPTVRQLTLRSGEVIAAQEEAARLPHWACPVIAKPRFGSASIGIVRLNSLDDFGRSAVVASTPGDYVVQTLAPGNEYTVDVFVDREGVARCAVPRRRLEVRAGEVSKGITARRPLLEDLVLRLAAELPEAFGALNVQVFVDETTGEMNVIEINARFGGGFPLAHQAGAPHARWLIQQALNMPLAPHEAAWQSDLVMLRYDAAVFVSAAEAGL